MQRGAITLRSKDGWSEEKGMEGYGPGNVSMLRVTRLFTNRVERHWTVVMCQFLKNWD